MRKLNILQVNGVWQLGRYDHGDEEDDEDFELTQEDFQGDETSTNNPPITLKY